MSQTNYTFEAMPQNLAKIQVQVENLSIDLKELTKILQKSRREPLEEFISIDEASKILRISRPSLYRLCQKSAVPYYKPAKELLFRKTDLIKWVESSRHEGYQSAEQMEAELSSGHRSRLRSRW